jgi:chaperonin GroES
MKIKDLRIRGQKVAVIRSEAPQHTGILEIPESAQWKPDEGEVVGVGDCLNDDGVFVHPGVEIGEKVGFKTFAASHTLKIEDQDVMFIPVKDLLYVVG